MAGCIDNDDGKVTLIDLDEGLRLNGMPIKKGTCVAAYINGEGPIYVVADEDGMFNIPSEHWGRGANGIRTLIVCVNNRWFVNTNYEAHASKEIFYGDPLMPQR